MKDDVKVVYIHGFASDKNSSTFSRILEAYPKAIALEYSSEKLFEENMQSLLAQIAGFDDIVFVGSSLGGYYAMQLSIAAKAYCRCVLINPCVNPSESLKKYIGKQLNFQTNEYFDFTLEATQSYPPLAMPSYSGTPTVVLLAKDDEVLDYKTAESLLKPYTQIDYITGGHRLSDYNKLLKEINEIQNAVGI